MQDVTIAIVTTVVGVIVAILVSRYYYTRTVKHRLGVYYMMSPSIFFGVDPDVRTGLSIQFRDEKVDQLTVINFLVANEGANAVRDAITPLTFDMGDKCRLIDASVTYVHPEGRQIDVEICSDRQFRCKFPLLNPDEYFYVKVIADGAVRMSDIKSSIAAENLPPNIDIKSAGRVDIGPERSRRDPGSLVASAVLLLIGLALALPYSGIA